MDGHVSMVGIQSFNPIGPEADSCPLLTSSNINFGADDTHFCQFRSAIRTDFAGVGNVRTTCATPCIVKAINTGAPGASVILGDGVYAEVEDVGQVGQLTCTCAGLPS
jgi:hypothetical protein